MSSEEKIKSVRLFDKTDIKPSINIPGVTFEKSDKKLMEIQ